MTVHRQKDFSAEDLSRMSIDLPQVDPGSAMFESGEFDRKSIKERLKAGNNSHQHIADSDKKLTAQERENGNRVE